jgi:AcrR family transcriptional regulator
MNGRSFSMFNMARSASPHTKTPSKKTSAATVAAAARSETKGERTRAVLIEASYQLFINRGYHGTSMRDIADEAGLALGGIYNHFATKEDIFVAMLMEHHPFLEVVPALQMARGESVEDLVRDAAQRMIAALSDKPDFLNLIFIELVEFEGKHVPQLFQLFFPPLMEFVQRFQQVQGELRPIPLPVILRSFIGLFFSYVITGLIIGSQLPASARAGAFDHFVDIYLHGILAKD